MKKTKINIILIVFIVIVYVFVSSYTKSLAEQKHQMQVTGHITINAYGVSENIRCISETDLYATELSLGGAIVYFRVFSEDLHTIQYHADFSLIKERQKLLESTLSRIIEIRNTWVLDYAFQGNDLEFLYGLEDVLDEFIASLSLSKENKMRKITNTVYIEEQVEKVIGDLEQLLIK